MCRGFQQNERSQVLNIKAFHLKLSTTKPLLDSLTLHYLPRINGSPLEINDCKIRPDSPAFVTLHRLVSSTGRFASRDRVMASEGVRFEVYLNDEKVLKGVFRKVDESNAWKIEYVCESSEVRSVEVSVTAEGGEKVDMVAVRRRKRCFSELEEIPEMEMEGDDCCCCCNYDDDDDDDDDGGDDRDNDWYCEEIERELEGVKWAVDVGIWVVCLGVGFLVTRRRRRRR